MILLTYKRQFSYKKGHGNTLNARKMFIYCDFNVYIISVNARNINTQKPQRRTYTPTIDGNSL